MVVRESFEYTALSGSRFLMPPALPVVTYFDNMVVETALLEAGKVFHRLQDHNLSCYGNMRHARTVLIRLVDVLKLPG